MKRHALIFVAPEKVEIQEETLSQAGRGQVVVRTLLSAISPGMEMLVYRGQAPQEMTRDDATPSLGSNFEYPFKYGYSVVGEVIAVGEDVDPGWIGRKVFSFHSHETAFTAPLTELIPLPLGIPVEDALFLPHMETAVNFLLDGHPLIGEAVAVFGLGIVGILTTALLVDFPLGALVTFDRYSRRRQVALELGATASLDPYSAGWLQQAQAVVIQAGLTGEYDLTFELSGKPLALNQAIAVTGFNGRVVIGSWYGKNPVRLELGGRFHRSRMRLISSQVSTMTPELGGRWNKARRMMLAWEKLRHIKPERWITHRFPFERAAEAYALLAAHPEQTIQVVLTYA